MLRLLPSTYMLIKMMEQYMTIIIQVCMELQHTQQNVHKHASRVETIFISANLILHMYTANRIFIKNT